MTSPQTDGLFERSPRNPILTAEDVPYPANAIFNPGAAQVGAETILLVRVEDSTTVFRSYPPVSSTGRRSSGPDASRRGSRGSPTQASGGASAHCRQLESVHPASGARPSMSDCRAQHDLVMVFGSAASRTGQEAWVKG